MLAVDPVLNPIKQFRTKEREVRAVQWLGKAGVTIKQLQKWGVLVAGIKDDDIWIGPVGETEVCHSEGLHSSHSSTV